MGIKSISFAATALVLSTSANAALINNGATTTDTLTNLIWLDVTLSVNRTHFDVSSNFGNGGDFEGFRYATNDELKELILNETGVIHTATDSQQQLYSFGSLDNIVNLLGITRSTRASNINSDTVSGYTASVRVYDSNIRNISSITTSNDELLLASDLASFNHNAGGLTFKGDSFGSFLVKDVATVPIPAAVWLFGSGLLGLIGVARRKKA